MDTAFKDFLSCLRGSELFESWVDNLIDFLSCLRGSELFNSKPKYLIFKELCRIWSFHPYFLGIRKSP